MTRFSWLALTDPVRRPLREAWDVLHDYDAATLRRDGIAGLTVAVVAIPQSMAYAVIAGVPIQYGLYTLIFQSLIGSLFNSQPLLSVGPTNTQSLLVASIVTRLADLGSEHYLQLVIVLTLLKGVLQLLMAAARLGNLVRYVSYSVVVGFTGGAGVLIIAGQVNHLLGFSVEQTAEQWPGLIGAVQRLWPHLDQTSGPAVGLGLLALAVVVGCRWWSKLAPGPLLAVVLSGVVVAVMGWTSEHLPLVDRIERALPSPSLPRIEWALLEPLAVGAAALALLGLMEAYSIGKSIAQQTGTRVSANQELFSQGLMNFLTGFLSCIPGSGSFARSALNHYAGARTFLAGIFNGLFVLAMFWIAAPLASRVPMTAIAAILFVIATGLIDWRYFRRLLRSNRADAAVCLGTFVSTLLLPLAYAVFVGVVLNLALYLRRASQLHINEMVRTPGGPFIERPLRDRAGDRPVLFLQMEGDLFFGVADELADRFQRIAHSGVVVVVVRLKRTLSIDTTVLGEFERFVQQMHATGRHVVLCGVKPELLETLRAFGLLSLIGPKNVFETSFGVFTSAKQALQRARQLLGRSIDTEPYDDDEAVEGWAYEI